MPRLSHLATVVVMATEVPSRELRNNSRALLRRVEEGEHLVITVDGRPVARLEPLDRRPRWGSGRELAEALRTNQADAGLTKELAELNPDTTDDLPWW